MTETERARARAELRALVAENATTLKLAPAAALDVVNRLLDAGAVMVGERVVMPCGTAPLAYAENVFRGDPDAAHLFRGPPDDVTPAAAPKPNPKGLSPDARLSLANGHEPFRRERR